MKSPQWRKKLIFSCRTCPASSRNRNFPSSVVLKPKKCHFAMLFHVQNGPNLSKPVQTCPNLSKPVQTCPKLSKLVSKMSKLVETCPNLSKMDQTYPKWIEIVLISTNMSKMDQTCSNLIKLDQTCPKGSNLSNSTVPF